MKWFSYDGIVKEIGRIRWPKGKELGVNTAEVLIVTIFFAIFFILIQLLLTYLLTTTGVLA